VPVDECLRPHGRLDKDLANADKSPRTAEAYAVAARAFIKSQGASTANVTREAIRAWMRSMKLLAMATQQTRCAGLASFVKWLVAEGVLDDNPMAGLKRPIPQAKAVDPYTKDAQQGLFDTCEPPGQPWSLRWIVTHMIEEYARHNGHADLLRECVDGSTGYY